MLVKWGLNAAAMLLVGYLFRSFGIPGFELSGLAPALAAALVLSVANTIIRPVLGLLTLPLNILTLGLFSFILSALMLKLTAYVVPGFSIAGWAAAIGGAVMLSVISTALNLLIK
jgi:putative membrane protein